MTRAALLLPVLLFAAGAACAQEAVTDPALAAQLATAVLQPRPAATLTVTSAAFPPGGDIPLENTCWRDNRFPGLAWTAGPRATKSYVIVMQDPDSQVKRIPSWP